MRSDDMSPVPNDEGIRNLDRMIQTLEWAGKQQKRIPNLPNGKLKDFVEREIKQLLEQSQGTSVPSVDSSDVVELASDYRSICAQIVSVDILPRNLKVIVEKLIERSALLDNPDLASDE